MNRAAGTVYVPAAIVFRDAFWLLGLIRDEKICGEFSRGRDTRIDHSLLTVPSSKAGRYLFGAH